MGAISKGKVLGGKKQWAHEVSDKAINKRYAEYCRKELNEKGEKTGKALRKHVISLYSTGICQVVKIRDVKKLRQDIKNNLIIKDQMAIDCLLVCTFSNFLAPGLFAAHTVNNLDPGNKKRFGKCWQKFSFSNQKC